MSEQENYRDWTIFPVFVGGSTVDDKRVSGPPQRMLPEIRDLATGEISVNSKAFTSESIKPRITVEIDKVSGRKTGIIRSINTGNGEETLYLYEPMGNTHRLQSISIKVKDILAFRVLKVEIPESSIRDVA